MNETKEHPHRLNLWGAGLIILLLGVTAVQGWILWRLWPRHPDQDAERSVLNSIQRWLPAAAHAPTASHDRLVLWESTDDVQRIHERIRKMLEAMSAKTHLPTSSSSPAGDNPDPSLLYPSPAGNPWADFQNLQHEIDAIFNNAFRDMDIFRLQNRLDQGWAQVEVSNSMNMEDQGEHYLVTVILPGLDKSSIAVNLQDRLLSIRADQEHQVPDQNPAANLRHQSRGCRHFETRLMLPGPVNADKVQASYVDGVLRIRAPKSADQELAKPIKVI